MSGHRDMDKFIDESRARQRNIVFPDTVRNGRSVDAFLWKGFPNPTLVQRIGAWLFGLLFMAYGLVLLGLAVHFRNKGDWPGSESCALIALAAGAIGIKTFRNGFPRKVRR